MSKRNKRAADRRPVQPPSANPPESRARIEALIAAGKTREALDLAKQWHKGAPGPEAEALVIETYEALIRQCSHRACTTTPWRWRRWLPSGSRPTASGHTDQVLSDWLGLNAAAVAELKSEGVV